MMIYIFENWKPQLLKLYIDLISINSLRSGSENSLTSYIQPTKVFFVDPYPHHFAIDFEAGPGTVFLSFLEAKSGSRGV